MNILFIFGIITIVTLIGLSLAVLGEIDKSKIIKQTQLIYEKMYLRDLKYKQEVLNNMNSKI